MSRVTQAIKVRKQGLWAVSRIFGIFPMSFKACQCRKGTTAERASTEKNRCQCIPLCLSLAWIIYSLAMLALLILWTVLNIYYRTQDTDIMSRDKIDMVVAHFDVISIAFIAAVCVKASLSQRGFLKFIELIQKVDTWLPDQRCPPKVPRWLTVWLGGVSLVMALDFTYKICEKSSVAFGTLPTYIYYLITYLKEALFIDEVNCVRRRFHSLNSELAASLADVNLGVDFHEAGQLQSPNGKFYRSRRGDTISEKRLVTLSQLTTVYDMLCQSVESLARRYSVFLLFDMLGLIVRFVSTSNFIINSMFEKTEDPFLTVFTVTQALWLFGHLIRMLILVTPCSKAMDEAHLTGTIVASIAYYDPLDVHLSRQLKSMSVYLAHRKVAISACGIFEMNLPLVCSVMGAVTTYLVVLIQLQVEDP